MRRGIFFCQYVKRIYKSNFSLKATYFLLQRKYAKKPCAVFISLFSSYSLGLIIPVTPVWFANSLTVFAQTSEPAAGVPGSVLREYLKNNEIKTPRKNQNLIQLHIRNLFQLRFWRSAEGYEVFRGKATDWPGHRSARNACSR